MNCYRMTFYKSFLKLHLLSSTPKNSRDIQPKVEKDLTPLCKKFVVTSNLFRSRPILYVTTNPGLSVLGGGGGHGPPDFGKLGNPISISIRGRGQIVPSTLLIAQTSGFSDLPTTL